MKYNGEKFDVAVIGAGHAGIEAGLASARLLIGLEICRAILQSEAHQKDTLSEKSTLLAVKWALRPITIQSRAEC